MNAPAVQTKISPQQLNALARQAVLSSSVPMCQQIYSQSVVPGTNATLNIQPRYVGFLRKFFVIISGTIHNNDGANALTLTNLGLANLLAPNSGIVLTDLTNNQRINTGGWHLTMLQSVKQRKPYAAGFLVETDEMFSTGENFGILASPVTIAASASQNFRAVFEVPVCYSDTDLRGGIFASVVNATMNLALTFNSAMFTATGTDSTFAVYKGTANATVTAAQVTVYQEYLDQLPQGPNGVILPMLDVSTMYELKNTILPGITANSENPYQYANFRSFLSTLVIYNSNLATDSGRAAGTDINYFSQQAANFTNIWKLDPLSQAQRTREILGTDLPIGCYYMSSRGKPIETTQYGNQELIINPNVATGTATMYIGLEDFALLNTVSQAGSLAG